jgi:hypothetical protein
VVASLVVGGVLLLAMIVASGWGALRLAADARIPVHFGSAEHCLLVSKRAGLVIWPAAGAVCYGVLGGIADGGMAANWVPGLRDVLVPAVIGVLLSFQVGALVLAGRSQGSRGVSATDSGAGDGLGRGTRLRSELLAFDLRAGVLLSRRSGGAPLPFA